MIICRGFDFNLKKRNFHMESSLTMKVLLICKELEEIKKVIGELINSIVCERGKV